jgi:hypothetical protein
MIDRTALSAAVKQKSPLTLEQIEKLFGGEITAENKIAVWRFLSMAESQQLSIWQVYCVTRHLTDRFTVEAVR